MFAGGGFFSDIPLSAAEAFPASTPVDATSSEQPHEIVVVNRGPVLTLWMAVVAEREGCTWNEGLTYGRVIAGTCAQAKGQRLGLISSSNGEVNSSKEQENPEKRQRTAVDSRRVCGRELQVQAVGSEMFAVENGAVVQPKTVQCQLMRAFGQSYDRVIVVLRGLAAEYDPSFVGGQAFSLYERFRPKISPGKAGWGQKGVLDLTSLQQLTNELAEARNLVWD